MKEKICLITGANSGIGKAAAVKLAKQGLSLVLVCRTMEKARSTAEEIRSLTSNPSIDALAGDLSSQTSIREMADSFRKKYDCLNILINNAGMASRSRSLSVDEIEMTFAVNHIAYFLLTHLLLDRLQAGTPARIINVSSDAHRMAKLDFQNLQGEKSYGGFSAYSLTKLCNLLFTYELARRLAGSGITVNALHPGAVATGIFRDSPRWMQLFVKWFALTPEKGAETIVYLATSPEVEGVTGKYFLRKKLRESTPASHDLPSAQKLWELSETMTAARSASGIS